MDNKKILKELRNDLFELRIKLANEALEEKDRIEYEKEVQKIRKQMAQEIKKEIEGEKKK